MRIALVCPYSLDAPGGVATHVIGLAGWLAGVGHQVRVIVPGTRDVQPPEEVEVHLLGRSRNFPFNGSVAQLAVGRRQAARAVRLARDADVVHVHEPLTPGIAFAVARACSPLVVTHHASFDAVAPVSWALRRRAAALTPAVSIAVSRAARTTARMTTGAGVDFTLIGNGVPMPPPPTPVDGWRDGARPRIAFLGRLTERRKGFNIFRAVALQAARWGMEAQFVALGPGRVEAGPVQLLGPVDDETRDKMLRTVDVVVAPNLGGESFGLVLVEALAAGCAVVASDLPGFRDVLEAAGTGELFPAGDVPAALAALHRVLATPPDPLLLHSTAQQWGWGVLGPRVLDTYEHASSIGHGNPTGKVGDGDGLGWAV